MIDNIPRGRNGAGVPRARVCCDACGREEVVSCDYERRGRGDQWVPNIGQIHAKMLGKGWALVRGSLICPACEASRKAALNGKGGKLMGKPEDLRKPTLDQRGDIIEMLTVAYDRKARRYKGSDTDKTIAEAVGEGCLPGWVAAIREQNFGPSGGNEEIEALQRAIADLAARPADLLRGFDEKIDEMTRFRDAAVAEVKDQLKALEKRLAAVCAAVGPRVGVK